VQFRDGYWHWEAKRPDGTIRALGTIPCTSAEELISEIEEVDALLRATCLSFFERRAVPAEKGK
jgi:hypothetical protein